MTLIPRKKPLKNLQKISDISFKSIFRALRRLAAVMKLKKKLQKKLKKKPNPRSKPRPRPLKMKSPPTLKKKLRKNLKRSRKRQKQLILMTSLLKNPNSLKPLPIRSKKPVSIIAKFLNLFIIKLF